MRMITNTNTTVRGLEKGDETEEKEALIVPLSLSGAEKLAEETENRIVTETADGKTVVVRIERDSFDKLLTA